MTGSSKSNDFIGCKIALLYRNQIVSIQRDDKPGLRFAGMWDLPGGGRENHETAIECAQREVYEELHMKVPADSIHYERIYPAMIEADQVAYFLVATIDKQQIDSIVFGDEGQGWKLMTVNEFIHTDNAVPDLKDRLHDYLKTI